MWVFLFWPSDDKDTRLVISWEGQAFAPFPCYSLGNDLHSLECLSKSHSSSFSIFAKSDNGSIQINKSVIVMKNVWISPM